MKQIIQQLKTFQEKHRGTILAVLVGIGIFAGVSAYAGVVTDIEHMVAAIIGDLTMAVTYLLGALISFFMYFLVDAASYNGFADAPAVIKGWVLMRDLANMGIVIGLLIVAFGSAFSDNYQLSKSLSTLVVTAIIINFSKTITLFMVDISQVIMMSFVNSFRDIGAGNIITILGIEKFFDPNTNADVGIVSSLAALGFTVFTMILVLGTLVVMTLTLSLRVIYLWFLIVLSPIAFAMYAIPVKKLQGIKDKWWEEITNWLVIGPMLAFFIWLTFISLGNATDMRTSSLIPTDQETLSARQSVTTNTSSLGKLGLYDQLAGFVIAIGMMLGGLKYSSEMAGSAGALAGKWKSYSMEKAGKIAKSAQKGLEARLYEGNIIPGQSRIQRFIPTRLQQGITSVARLATSRGRAEAEERMLARVESGVGGAASAGVMKEVKDKQAEARQKDLRVQQVMNNKDDWNAALADAKAKGDADKVRALIQAGSTEWGIDQSEWESAKDVLQKSFGSDEKGFVEFALQTQRDNKKHGVALDTTEQVVDENGNVVQGLKSKDERMKKIISDMNQEEKLKFMRRNNAISGTDAEVRTKVGEMAKDSQLVGKMSGGERGKIAKKIEELRANKDYWDKLTEDQKLEHEKMYEAATAEYDPEGRRKESEEWVMEERINKKTGLVEYTEKKKNIKSQGKNLEATVNDPSNRIATQLKDAETVLADNSASDRAKARARLVIDTVNKQHKTNYKNIADQKEIIKNAPSPTDPAATTAEARINKILNSEYNSSYDMTTAQQIEIQERTQDKLSGKLKETRLDRFVGGGKQIFSDVKSSLSSTYDSIDQGFQKYIAESTENFARQIATDFDETFNKSENQNKLTSNAMVAQYNLDRVSQGTVADKVAYMGLTKSSLDSLQVGAERVMVELGIENESSGQIDQNGNVITNQQAVQRLVDEAKAKLDVAMVDPTNDNKRVSAEEAVQDVLLTINSTKESKRKVAGFENMRNGRSRGKLESRTKSLDDAKKSTNEEAIMEMLEQNLAFITKDLMREVQMSGADNDAVRKYKEGIERTIRGIIDNPDPAKTPRVKAKEVQDQMRKIDDDLFSGRYFKLKTRT